LSKICKACNAIVAKKDLFCKHCRSQEFMEIKVCQNCGEKSIRKNTKFCPNCGKRIGFTNQDLIFAKSSEPLHCGICKQDITEDMVFCPICRNTFHFSHLKSWLQTNKNCPMCKKELVLRKNFA